MQRSPCDYCTVLDKRAPGGWSSHWDLPIHSLQNQSSSRMIPEGFIKWLIWKSNQRKSFKWSFNTYIIYIYIYISIHISYIYINISQYIYINLFECFKLWPGRAESASTTLPRKGHVIRERLPQRGPFSDERPNFSSFLRWNGGYPLVN
jgi:hypothetical protein